MAESRGGISCLWHVWCGKCGFTFDVDEIGKRAVHQAALAAGYTFNRQRGYRCARCTHQETCPACLAGTECLISIYAFDTVGMPDDWGKQQLSGMGKH